MNKFIEETGVTMSNTSGRSSELLQRLQNLPLADEVKEADQRNLVLNASQKAYAQRLASEHNIFLRTRIIKEGEYAGMFRVWRYSTPARSTNPVEEATTKTMKAKK